MNRNQLLLIIGGVLMVVALYFFGKTKLPKQTTEEAIKQKDIAAAIDFNTMIDSAKAEFAESQIQNLEKLESQLSNATENKSKAEVLKQLVERWDTYQKPEIAAQYAFQLAETEPNEENWTAAAGKFVFSANVTKDSLTRSFLISRAIISYQKAIVLNPDNMESKIALATCYVYGSENTTMQGVTLLLEVAKKDSNNVKANFLLGKLAMTSGQYEKAVARFEKVVSLDTGNVEVYLNLAEANQSLGNNKRAIEIFEKCKTLVSNPAFQKEIDNYINKLKTN